MVVKSHEYLATLRGSWVLEEHELLAKKIKRKMAKR